jgi:hypothetical protein
MPSGRQRTPVKLELSAIPWHKSLVRLWNKALG